MSDSDLDLLRRFACDHSQDAFTGLVKRHLNLVYSAALRQVRSPQLAEEVTQSVFADLARSGTGILPVNETNSLAPWLYAVTRRTAIDVIRKESRRQLREQIAVEMNHMNATNEDWNQIEPLLDDAMAALDETDRSAILLRFFENKSLREVGESLQISDDAAQKRVGRAVERLREFFTKQKITIGAGGLIALVSANAVQSAPIGLVATISAAALAGTAVTTSALIAATKTIAMTTLQKTLVTATVAVLAGAGIYQAKQAHDARAEVQTLQQQQVLLAEQAQQLQHNFADATNRLADLLAENPRFKSNSHELELLKLRGEVTLLRRQAAESANRKSMPDATTESELTTKSWLERVQLLRQKLESMPSQKNPENSFLTEDDWLQAAKHRLDSDDDYLAAFAELRASGEGHFLRTAEDALRNYLQTNNGVFPADIAELKPFFKESPSDAILQRYDIVPSSSIPQNNLGNGGDWLITLKNPDSGALQTLSANGISGTSQEDADTMAVLAPAMKAMFANSPSINGRKNFSIEMLEPYLTTPEQKAAYQKLLLRSKINSKP